MPDELIFRMGKYKARIPCHLFYTKDHLWIRKGEDVSTVGITAYRQRFFMDVEDVSFDVDEGDVLEPRAHIATVEGLKAVSEIVTDFIGEIVELNEELDLSPTLINEATYEDGWLFKVKDLEGDLLGPAQYLEFVQRDWDETVEAIVNERGDGKVLPF